jgi:hypothetical protein
MSITVLIYHSPNLIPQSSVEYILTEMLPYHIFSCSCQSCKIQNPQLYSLHHKVLIYIEHHSVCPLVGIGTPPPL